MPRYTIQDGAEISYSVNWPEPGSQSDPTVHGIDITRDGQLIGPDETAEILARWTDDCLIARAGGIERERATAAADRTLKQRDA